MRDSPTTSKWNALLGRILRRSRRDVALAGAMVGVVSSMQKLFPVIERYSKLTVTFYDGRYLWWEYAPCERPSGVWNDFLKWFHGRPQSETYVMRYKDGSNMFRRCDIRTYTIVYAEREKQSS